MATTYTNMGLKGWNLGTDFFNYAELDANFSKIDAHDHTGPPEGVQIPTGGIVDNAITTAKIADSQITSAKILDGTIAAGDIASNAVTTAKILDANVTAAKLATNAKTSFFRASMLASQTLTTSFVDLSGATLTFTPAVASVALIFSIFDFDATALPGETVTMDGKTLVDGVDQGDFASIYANAQSATGASNGRSRGAATQVYTTALTAASHTIKLQGRMQNGASGGNVAQDSTSILVVVFPA